MEKYLNAYYPQLKGEYKRVQLFGYATNGIPGIEIVGLGKHNRSLKEKLVFFVKRLRLKVPIKRFVLCVEESEIYLGDFTYLEFPFFFLFLNISGALQVKNLENCLCSGRLLLNGNIQLPVEQRRELEWPLSYTLLVGEVEQEIEGQRALVIEELFAEQGIKIGIMMLKLPEI